MRALAALSDSVRLLRQVLAMETVVCTRLTASFSGRAGLRQGAGQGLGLEARVVGAVTLPIEGIMLGASLTILAVLSICPSTTASTASPCHNIGRHPAMQACAVHHLLR